MCVYNAVRAAVYGHDTRSAIPVVLVDVFSEYGSQCGNSFNSNLIKNHLLREEVAFMAAFHA